MTLYEIIGGIFGLAISAFTVVQMHKDRMNADIEKAREKSVGAKAIADLLNQLSGHEQRLNTHDNRMTRIEEQQKHMDREYLKTLQDFVNHYTRK